MTMRVRNGLLTAALLGLALTIAQVAAQQAPAPPQQPAPPAGGAQGEGRGGRVGRAGGPGAPAGPAQGGGNRQATFPAGQRPPDDPAIVARGKTLYEANCQLCHGRDLRGGDQGGPNLLRSPVTLEDRMGELVIPIIRNGTGKMQPVAAITNDDDAKAVALYLHAIAATMTGQGGPPRGNPMPPAEAVLVGDTAAGRAYFQAKCAGCHSVTGDLQGIGNRYPDPRTLQSSWVAGSAGGGRGGFGGGGRGGGRPVTVTVTLANGQKVEGRLGRIDDFIVVVNMEDGTQRSFTRNGAVPKVDVKNPLQGHYDLIAVLTDKDMHDVTAYLASLK